MSIYVDILDATHSLAVAAAAIIRQPVVGDLRDALDRLAQAVEQYELTELATPIPIFRPYQSCDCKRQCTPATGPLDDNASRRTRRFRAALATVDWRAQSPAGLADLLISICADVTAEKQIPTFDPATILVASKIAAVCGLDVDDERVAELIHECFHRSKQGDSRSPLTN